LTRKRTKTEGDAAGEIVLVAPEPGGLSQAQHVAIGSLMTGQTITDAAQAASVTRETVSRWLNHDPAFQAELGRQRAALHTAVDDRLRNLTGQALDTLESLMNGGSHDIKFKVALAVLSMADGTRRRIGPTSEGAARAEAQLQDMLDNLGG
jgi:CRP-like cAMP-binding protein